MRNFLYLIFAITISSCSTSRISRESTELKNENRFHFYIDTDSLYTIPFSVKVPSDYVAVDKDLLSYLVSYKSHFGILINMECNKNYQKRDTTYIMADQEAYSFFSGCLWIREENYRREPDSGMKHLFITKKGVEILLYNISKDKDVEYLRNLVLNSLVVKE